MRADDVIMFRHVMSRCVICHVMHEPISFDDETGTFNCIWIAVVGAAASFSAAVAAAVVAIYSCCDDAADVCLCVFLSLKRDCNVS